MSCFQILDGACAAQVEEIGSRSVVTGSPSLSLTDVSGAMLHDDAFTQATAPRGGGDQLPKSVLEAFVLGDGDGTSGAASRNASSLGRIGLE